MPDWDEDSPQLRQNLGQVLREISAEARQRSLPKVDLAKHWQTVCMQGLDAGDQRYVGAFRGEPGLENIGVRVGPYPGTHPARVAHELSQFETRLQAQVTQLDAALPVGRDPDAAQLAAILDLCAWAHAEWVRIHPFANGNGRTARFWANYLAMRYGLPPFIRLRPRPDGGYGEAGAKAMQGNWQPTAVVFRRLWYDFLTGV